MNHSAPKLDQHSAGLGLRRVLLNPLLAAAPGAFDFLECAPDNWIGVGGRFGKSFAELAERYPIVCHGLSLSLGGIVPFDQTYLLKIKKFLQQFKVPIFSEHLSYCSDDGQLYDLMPIPFTEEAVEHCATRIRQVQDALGRRIAVENVSYYAAPFQAMREIDFINAVVDKADCDILLDVNNIFVNSINHKYDAAEFLRAIPRERIAYYHVAGHYDEAEDLKVDTHGATVKPDVWSLLDLAYQTHGLRPTLLERDFNFPPFDELLGEVIQIRKVQSAYAKQADARARA